MEREAGGGVERCGGVGVVMGSFWGFESVMWGGLKNGVVGGVGGVV